MLESTIEKNLVAYAKKRGILTRKFTSPGHQGVPDRLFVYMGNVLLLELKRKGNRPTPLQMKEMTTFHNQGIPTAWVDNMEDGKSILDLLASRCPDLFMQVSFHQSNGGLKYRA